MVNYYLLNGKKGEANALKLKVDGELQRNFIDIASLDLETLKIKREDAKDVLAEYNEGLDLSGMFYDASYPHKQREIKTYPAIFDLDNEKTRKYMDKLRYYAEERDYKKRNGRGGHQEDKVHPT